MFKSGFIVPQYWLYTFVKKTPLILNGYSFCTDWVKTKFTGINLCCYTFCAQLVCICMLENWIIILYFSSSFSTPAVWMYGFTDSPRKEASGSTVFIACQMCMHTCAHMSATFPWYPFLFSSFSFHTALILTFHYVQNLIPLKQWD